MPYLFELSPAEFYMPVVQLKNNSEYQGYGITQ